MTELESEPLEVFHYHKAIIDCNYKLWHDTNSEFYHDYMHYHNRVTSMMQPGYYDRKYTVVRQRALFRWLDGGQVRSLQGLRRPRPVASPACRATAGRWSICFPASPTTFAAPVCVVDTMTPLSARSRADRVPRSRAEAGHAGGAAGSAFATTTRSGDRSAATCTKICSASPARVIAMQPRSGAPLVRPARPARGRHHPRRDRDAPLLWRVGSDGWVLIPANPYGVAAAAE